MNRSRRPSVDEIYARPGVLDRYRPDQGLFPVERMLFARHIGPEADVLDLGIGAGRTTAALVDDLGSYVGIDLAPIMIDAARSHFPGTDLRVGDASSLAAFTDGRFDVVVFSFNGIDHLSGPDRRRCLAECARVLRDGGTLILSRHNPRGIAEAPRRTVGAGRKLRAMRAAKWWAASLWTLCRRIPTRAFVVGDGAIDDDHHGGMRLAMAVPARAIAEIESQQFIVIDGPHGYDPTTAFHTWRTPWYYLAATRATR